MKSCYLAIVLVGLLLSVSVTNVEGQFGVRRGFRPGFRRGFLGGLLIGGLIGRRFGGGFRGYPRFGRPGFFG